LQSVDGRLQRATQSAAPVWRTEQAAIAAVEIRQLVRAVGPALSSFQLFAVIAEYAFGATVQQSKLRLQRTKRGLGLYPNSTL
jgi:hypothetical protein